MYTYRMYLNCSPIKNPRQNNKLGTAIYMRKGLERKQVGFKTQVKLGSEAEGEGEAESDTGEEREKDTERER